MRKNSDGDPQRSRKEAEVSTSSTPAPAVISSEALRFLPLGSMTPGKLTNASRQPTSQAHKQCSTYGLMLCGHHLKVLSHFIFEFVFCSRVPMRE